MRPRPSPNFPNFLWLKAIGQLAKFQLFMQIFKICRKPLVRPSRRQWGDRRRVDRGQSRRQLHWTPRIFVSRQRQGHNYVELWVIFRTTEQIPYWIKPVEMCSVRLITFFVS